MRSALTLAQLRLLDALARTGSITSAARALSISQPSVSTQLRTLEARYRMRFFNRKGKALEPTAEGLALLPRIRALLALADEIEYTLQAMRELEQGRLKVGYSTHRFVMRVLGEFMDRHRGVKIEARSMASFDLLALMRRGEIDADGGELGEDPEIVAVGVDLPGRRPLTGGHYLVCLTETRPLAAVDALFAIAGRTLQNLTVLIVTIALIYPPAERKARAEEGAPPRLLHSAVALIRRWGRRVVPHRGCSWRWPAGLHPRSASR